METKMLYGKIQAGKYKGKKIQLPSLETTRSTKAILKGSFFDTVQYDLYGMHFVELFGGSGSMGLEALSRGAKHAYFIEKDTKAFAILKKNCQAIAPEETTCLQGDSFELLPRLLKTFTCKTFFYIDPPFSIREGMEKMDEKVLEAIHNLPSALVALIALEHRSTFEPPGHVGMYHLQKTKRFGVSSLSYYL